MAIVAKEPQQGEATMSEIRNQLKSQSLADLEASSIATVGGRVFPDNAASIDLRALREIVDSWRSTHAPAYGAPIGGTDDVATHNMQTDGIEAVFTPSGKQVARIVAVQVANGGGAPMTADLYVGGVLTGAAQININPSEAAGFAITSDLFAGSTNPVQIKLPTGSASDATVKVAYILTGV